MYLWLLGYMLFRTKLEAVVNNYDRKKELHKLELTDLYVCISIEVFNHTLENTDEARGTACKHSFHGYRNHN